MTSSEPATQLRTISGEAAVALAAWTDERASRPLAPGKWSPKQVLGHLIDSASVNHERFVRAQGQDDLRFPGYAQEDWVRLQGYGEADWVELVALWRALNQHIARVMERTVPALRTRVTRDHDFHRIAWEVVEEGQPATLEGFHLDYVNHLRHHLRQMDQELADAPRMQQDASRTKDR